MSHTNFFKAAWENTLPASAECQEVKVEAFSDEEEILRDDDIRPGFRKKSSSQKLWAQKTFIIPRKVVMIPCQFMLSKMIIRTKNLHPPSPMMLRRYRNEINTKSFLGSRIPEL